MINLSILFFSLLLQEPMVSGLANLENDDVSQLESYLGMSLASISSGRDLNTLVTYYLELLESMWMTQALKEKQFDAWFSALRITHTEAVSISIFYFFTDYV